MTNTAEPKDTEYPTTVNYWKTRHRLATARLSAVEAENEKLREALINLNSAIDRYWNDDSQSFNEIAEHHLQRITKAQMAARNALTKGKDDG